MKCPNCGFENRPDARFCKNCRQPMQTAPPVEPSATSAPPAGVCPACGATAKPGARFCPRCGRPLPTAPTPPAPAAPTPYTQLPPTVPSMPTVPPQPPIYAQPPTTPPPPAAERGRGGPGWALWVALAAMFLCIVALVILGIVFRREVAATLGLASPTTPSTGTPMGETPTFAPTPTWTPTPSQTDTPLSPTATPGPALMASPEPVFDAVVGLAVSAVEVAAGDRITVTITVTNTGGLPFIITGYQLVGRVAPFLELLGQPEPSGSVIDPGGADSATFVLSAASAGEVAPRVVVTIEVQTTPPFVEIKESPPIPITVR